MSNETLTAILNEKDKLSAYMGVGVDYYKGETGKSGADEVYIGAEPPTDPQVKLWVDTEDQSYVPVEWKDVGNKPDFATVATSGDYKDLENKPDLFSGNYEDLENKPTIPDAYTLPTASTDTLGGVKVDGETITIADGVISSAGGGGTDLSNTLFINSSKSNDIHPELVDTLILGSNNNVSYELYGRNGKIEDVIILGNQHFVTKNTYASLIMGTQNFISGERSYNCGIAVGAGNWVNATQNTQYTIMVGQGNEINQGNYPYTVQYVFGLGNNLKICNQNFVIGQYNIEDSDSNYRLIIGNGNSNGNANALTVNTTGNLAIAGTMSSAGADYAEFFEWKDGNPEAQDRVGYIVALDGDKLTLANEGDYILGVVSGTATVLGDNPEWNWAKRWVTDDFGRIQYEDKVIHHEAEERNGETIPAWDETIKAPVVNPDYDPNQEYTKRADRPEWSAVGMMGKLYVRDDGTCQVNGFAKPINGVATASTSGMRVIERVSDNVIRVVIK